MQCALSKFQAKNFLILIKNSSFYFNDTFPFDYPVRIKFKMKSKSVIEKTKLEFFKTFPIERIMAELNFKIFGNIWIRTQKSRKWGFSFSQLYFFILQTALMLQRMILYRE